MLLRTPFLDHPHQQSIRIDGNEQFEFHHLYPSIHQGSWLLDHYQLEDHLFDMQVVQPMGIEDKIHSKEEYDP